MGDHYSAIALFQAALNAWATNHRACLFEPKTSADDVAPLRVDGMTYLRVATAANCRHGVAIFASVSSKPADISAQLSAISIPPRCCHTEEEARQTIYRYGPREVSKGTFIYALESGGFAFPKAVSASLGCVAFQNASRTIIEARSTMYPESPFLNDMIALLSEVGRCVNDVLPLTD